MYYHYFSIMHNIYHLFLMEENQNIYNYHLRNYSFGWGLWYCTSHIGGDSADSNAYFGIVPEGQRGNAKEENGTDAEEAWRCYRGQTYGWRAEARPNKQLTDHFLQRQQGLRREKVGYLNSKDVTHIKVKHKTRN